MKTKTHFPFRVDIWDDTGDSIVEHVAGVDDFEVAEATFRAAVARWPAARRVSGNHFGEQLSNVVVIALERPSRLMATGEKSPEHLAAQFANMFFAAASDCRNNRNL